MLEFPLCIMVAVAGGAEVEDCSFTIRLLTDESYTELADGRGLYQSRGFVNYNERMVYINERYRYSPTIYELTVQEHEIYHAALYLDWIASGSPGVCWCTFHPQKNPPPGSDPFYFLDYLFDRTFLTMARSMLGGWLSGGWGDGGRVYHP